MLTTIVLICLLWGITGEQLSNNTLNVNALNEKKCNIFYAIALDCN